MSEKTLTRSVFPLGLLLLVCSQGLASSLDAAELSKVPAEDPIEKGYQKFYEGDVLGAYEYFRDLVQREPDNLAAAYGALSALYARDQTEHSLEKEFERRAADLIEKAANRYENHNKSDLEALFYLAQTYGLRGGYRFERRQSLWGAARDAAKSKKYSEEYVKLKPNHADAYVALGLYNYYVDIAPSFVKILRVLLFLPGGSRTEGLKQLERAARQGELWSPQAKLELIRIYGWLEGRVGDAVRLAEELQQSYPENPGIRFRLARLYAGPVVEDHARAAEHLEFIAKRARDGHPHYQGGTRYEALQGLAEALRRQWQIREAIDVLTPVIEQQPDKPDWVLPQFLLNRAGYRARLNDPQAQTDLRRILREEKWDDQWHEVARKLSKEIERRKATGEAAVYFDLIPGNRLVAEERWEEARRAYERVAKRHPGDWQVRYRLAYLAYGQGEWRQAAAAFRAVAEQRRVPAWLRARALLFLARTYDLQGQRKQALEYYEEVVDDYEEEGQVSLAARIGMITPYRRLPAHSPGSK